MTSPVELCEAISRVTGLQYATVDTAWKALRLNHLVVNSGRGNRGTQVSSKDMATLLTALCGVIHIGDAVSVVRRFKNSGFIDALADVIEAPRAVDVQVHAEKILARIGDRRFGNGKSLKATLLEDNAHSKSPITDLGDMVFIRGVSRHTLDALNALLDDQRANAA